MSHLPRGVALVYARVEGRPVVIVSDRLSHDQEIVARAWAAFLAANAAYVMLTYSDVLNAMRTIAA